MACSDSISTTPFFIRRAAGGNVGKIYKLVPP
jgi:hypothetical protein